MPRFILSPLAQADLDEIWDYTAEHWNIDQAEIYIREVGEAVQALAANPQRGRPCDAIRTGYCRYQTGSHIIFYCLVDIGFDVKRILHERMDFERHL